MRVYLIKTENELQIHQIRPDQEIRFLALHGDKILMTGETIREVLTKFDELDPLLFMCFTSITCLSLAVAKGSSYFQK
jgi:hypothetical protein